MATKRRLTRDEIEQEAAAELDRSMQRSRGAQRSANWGAPSSSAPGPAPASPAAPKDEGGGSPWGSYTGERRLSASEEEEAVTELAIAQMAERRGGEAGLDSYIMTRVQPSQAEEARDRALQEAVARQARFAKPARRVPVPQATSRGFASSWTTSSPSADSSSEPMVWESAVPTATTAVRKPARAAATPAPAKRAPAKRKAPATKKAAPKRAPAKRKAPARKRAAPKRVPTKRAPTKKASPARKAAPAKKAPARKAASAKKAAPARKAPAKRKAAAAKKKAPAKRASGRR